MIENPSEVSWDKTAPEQPLPLEQLLKIRRRTMETQTAVDKMISEAGPLSLQFQFQTIQQDLVALLARMETLQMALERSGIDAFQVDMEDGS